MVSVTPSNTHALEYLKSIIPFPSLHLNDILLQLHIVKYVGIKIKSKFSLQVSLIKMNLNGTIHISCLL